MTGQIVVVTGAGSGIGRTCARDMLKDGYKVAALDVNPVPDDVLSAGPAENSLALQIDVSSLDQCRDAVRQTVEKFGGLDALCHFAGIHSTLNWEDLAAQEFSRVLEVNVIGTFHMSKAAGEYMKEHGGGAIVLTTSSSVQASGIGGGNGRGGPA